VNFLRDIAAERIVGKGAAGYAMALGYIATRVTHETAR
jgi:3-dehydroquinate dehydratase